MPKSQSHKRAQSQAAGKKGKTEVKLKNKKILDAVTESGKRATEIEKSGSPKKLEVAAKRLKIRRSSQKVLQVPQKDMLKATKAMRKVRAKGTVKNMAGTKRISVS